MPETDSPRVDPRNYQQLLEDAECIVPLYTPEWNIADEKDTGYALLRIFTHMQEEIVNRLNRVPDKNFTAFLEMLGIRLMPAQPARVPVTFYLPERLSGGVLIPARTQVATEKTEKHGALTYETVNSLFATSAALYEIYCVDPKKDEIFRYSYDLNKKEFTIFTGENLQEHILYLGHDDLFKLEKTAQIQLKIALQLGSIEDMKDWEYWGEDEEHRVSFLALTEGDETLILKKTEEGEVQKKEINGIESHWIHCRLSRAIEIREISILDVTPVVQPADGSNSTSEDQDTNGDESGGTSDGTSNKPADIKPDICYYNFIPLDCSQPFDLFSKQPRLFDTFYMASRDAFTKKNAFITITFSIDQDNIPVPNDVELSWEYWNGKVWKLLEGIDKNINFSSDVTILFTCPDDFQEFEVNGEKNYWIRVRLVKGDYGKEEFKPENPNLFRKNIDNNLEMELNQGPISAKPNLKKAFLDNDITLSENAFLGDGWVISDNENTYYLAKVGDKLNVYKEVVWAVSSNFNPPVICDIGITYSFKQVSPASGESSPGGGTPEQPSSQGLNLHHCLTKNNLEFRDFTLECREGTKFQPFIPLPETQPTLYLGFTDEFRKGNISIFFSLSDEKYHPEEWSKILWTYWSTAPNLEAAAPGKVRLVSLEGMASSTELLFHEPSDIETITGSAKIKAISYNDREITMDKELDHIYSGDARIFRRTFLEVTDNTEYLTKSESLEFIGPTGQEKTPMFGKECYWLMGTFVHKKIESLIKGIYPNTVWAEQLDTINNEVIGSGDGEKKNFTFIRSPVVSPDIWVMEEPPVSKDGKEELTSEDMREVKDETGKVLETWVRWKLVEDFIDPDPRSRHYIVDHAMGQVQFGDGTNGMIPPIGTNNIKANYKSGGGVSGNIMKHEINVLKSPIARIDSVINHEPAEEGSDTELLEEVLERGPHVIKHRDKAVTVEDFERIAREASNYIARTNCSIEGSTIKIIIIPKSEDDRPQPSPGLTKIVRDHLLKRSLNSILSRSLEVTGPSYKEVKVTVDVFPKSIDDVIPLEKMIIKRLKEYLHPLTGGPENHGWEFGRGVHISDVYSMLEGIDRVDHVENLTLKDAPGDIEIQKSENVSSGEHRITMKLRS